MTNTSTIGATARDYSTIEAWEAATDNVLTDHEVGECYHDGVAGATTFSLGSGDNRIEFAGATTTASFYRELTVASGHKYDPVYQTGVFLTRTIGTASETVGDALYINEDHFRCTGFAIKDAGTPTSGFSAGIRVGAVDSVQVSRNYVQWATGWSDGTDGTAYSDGVRILSSATNCTIDNNILLGGGALGNRGMSIGIRFDASSGTNKAIHNTVIDVKAYREDIGATNRGISGSGTTGARLLNNICINCSTQDADTVISTFDFYNFSSDSGWNISSDTSAGYSINGSNITQVILSELFLSAVNFDYRNLSTSPATGNGYEQITTELDFAGNVRSTISVDIGAMSGYVSAFESPVEEIISSIGTGKDYTTIAAWLSATEGHLVENNQRHIGELYNETYASVSRLDVGGSITEYPRNRVLRVASGHEYDPVTGLGAIITNTATGDNNATLRNTERDFELRGPVKITKEGAFTNPGFNTVGVVESIGVPGVVLDALFVTLDDLVGVINFAGIWINGGGGKITNCPIWGHDNADDTSINIGIVLNGGATGAGWLVANNTVWGVDHSTTSSFGIASLSAAPNLIVNNVCIGADFDIFVGSNDVLTNISGDATGDITNKTAAEVLADVTGLDFRLAPASPALLTGTDKLFDVPTDASGASRHLPFAIGAYDSAAVHPQVPSPGSDRTCVAFEITRTDGVVLRLVDNTSMLRMFGFAWEPMASQPTARRSQTGLTPNDADFGGIIDSDLITEADLVAGKYAGALVREFVLDWRYPWTLPLGTSRYRLGRIQYDDSRWVAETGSFASQLQNKTGRLISRTCDATLGDDRCTKVVTTQAETIESVKVPRTEFYLDETALSPATDGWYDFAELVWTSGRNAGQDVEVRSNAVVDVNLLSVPANIAGWTLSGGVAASSGAATAPDGVNEAYVIQSNSGAMTAKLQVGTWADRDQICISVHVSDQVLATHSEELRLSLWQDTDIEHYTDFKWDGTTWTNDGNGTIEETAWGWRMSYYYKATGDEFGDMFMMLTHGQANFDKLEVALPQFEEGCKLPTTWTEDPKQHIVLAYPTILDMAIGEGFDIKPGCNLLKTTCKDKFDNVKNFRGFDSVPGTKKAMVTPTS